MATSVKGASALSSQGLPPANICLEPTVTLRAQELEGLGENFEKARRGFIDSLLLDARYAFAEAQTHLLGPSVTTVAALPVARQGWLGHRTLV